MQTSQPSRTAQSRDLMLWSERSREDVKQGDQNCKVTDHHEIYSRPSAQKRRGLVENLALFRWLVNLHLPAPCLRSKSSRRSDTLREPRQATAETTQRP